MPLESTLIIIDNSEYMRNGDYHPNRFQAQADAVTTLFQTKVDSNPENTVGFMTMAGKGPEVLVTHTKDLGKILGAIHTAQDKIGGVADIPTAIAVAQLALKHRSNKNLRQRVVVFVGSPLEGQGADEKYMTRLAKKLKKNNVAVDFVAFGDGIEEGERSILKTFVDNANSGDNCHYLAVPPGTHLLSDMILNSPILAGDRGIPEEAMGDVPSGSAGGGGGFEFGVDPSLDPELAMALRMSMEEEQARQAAAAQAAGSSSAGAASAPAPAAAASSAPAQTSAPAAATAATAVDEEEDEEAMLQKALAMSQGQDVEMADHAGDGEEESEEDAIKRAIEMSMKEHQQQQ
ncbi:hypothetical protein C8Q70DRAFT_1057603 [Cubamyces menziesii]|uniref:VWFA domain-containing protein n=1 Tax=Trametes cubensis TaxID=1111947 RepID=A0AAD7TRH5_9APHY|nr:hypothetical protein C8Q70DRAFT_1057603 [Cubamyces menziesii]KAJ8474929.1 hypothetical protein ONZ51_g6881 [Trametes cubensis]